MYHIHIAITDQIYINIGIVIHWLCRELENFFYKGPKTILDFLSSMVCIMTTQSAMVAQKQP